MQHHSRFRHRAQHITAHHGITRLGNGGKLPQLLAIQRRHFHTAGDVGAHALDDLLQRALDTVIDVLDQAGTQLHAQRCAGGDHLGTGAQTAGLLIDLNGGLIACHI